MAVDYGDARTGVAVSDESAAIVGQAWVINEKSMQKVAGALAEEASARNVSCIIIGYPKNMNGTIGPRGEKSEQLLELLSTQCAADIKLWDERLSTVSANRILADAGKGGKKRKKTVDAVAASIILESYLNSL